MTDDDNFKLETQNIDRQNIITYYDVQILDLPQAYTTCGGNEQDPLET